MISVGTIKLVAKAIDYKFPGSCTELIKSLDEITHSSGYLKYRMKELEDTKQKVHAKWQEYKGRFTDSEISSLSDKVGLDISNPNQWDEITERIAENATMLTGETIFEPDPSFWDEIVDFFASIFD